MNKDSGQLKSSHVPDPNSRRHGVALSGHVVTSVAPLDGLDASRRALNSDLLKGSVLEALYLLLADLRNLDNLVVLVATLVADVLECLATSSSDALSHFLLVNEELLPSS